MTGASDVSFSVPRSAHQPCLAQVAVATRSVHATSRAPDAALTGATDAAIAIESADTALKTLAPTEILNVAHGAHRESAPAMQGRCESPGGQEHTRLPRTAARATVRLRARHVRWSLDLPSSRSEPRKDRT